MLDRRPFVVLLVGLFIVLQGWAAVHSGALRTDGPKMPKCHPGDSVKYARCYR